MKKIERQARELLGKLIKYRSLPSKEEFIFREKGELDAKKEKRKIPKLVARSNYQRDPFDVRGVVHGEKYLLESGLSGDIPTVALSPKDTNKLVRKITPKKYGNKCRKMRREKISHSNYVPVVWFDSIKWDKT